MDIRDAIRQFIVTQLIRNPKYKLTDTEALITGGLIDSFSLTEVGLFLEQQFKIRVPDSDLTVDMMDSVEQIATYVEARLK
jgi:acyl carrier protein